MSCDVDTTVSVFMWYFIWYLGMVINYVNWSEVKAKQQQQQQNNSPEDQLIHLYLSFLMELGEPPEDSSTGRSNGEVFQKTAKVSFLSAFFPYFLPSFAFLSQAFPRAK